MKHMKMSARTNQGTWEMSLKTVKSSSETFRSQKHGWTRRKGQQEQDSAP